MGNKPSLLGLSLEELTEVALALGLPKFVGKQICGWLYDKHARSFDEMTNLSKAARQKLAENYQIGISTPVESVESKDGTIKYLYKTERGHYIEQCTSLTGNALRSACPRKWAARWLVNFA